MLIDHVGLIFFPDYVIFRVIGRFSFPLFAWGIAQGAKYSHDLNKYAWRLFIFALISQYPFYLYGSIASTGIASLNVLFTLLLGLLSVSAYRSRLPMILKIACIYLCCYFSISFNTDYQAVGVLSVLFSYIFAANISALFASQLFLYASPFILVLIYRLLGFSTGITGIYTLLSPFSFFLTRLFPGQPHSKFKYLFYFVYPLQFLIIFILKKYVFD